MKNRWPKSVHCQVEAVFHAVRSFREPKERSPLGVRSFGSWQVYRINVHRFIKYASHRGLMSILDINDVMSCMPQYLDERLKHCCAKKLSRQTMETTLAALGKLEYAINRYCEKHMPEQARLDTKPLRKKYYAAARTQLRKSSRIFSNRAYPDPIGLIRAITGATYQLQACLQYEGGMRAEGVGAPSHQRVKNPLTASGLHGFGIDPVTGAEIGIVASVEKGGKPTEHFLSVETYRRLERYIRQHGKLESDYMAYVDAINRAAMATGQHATGRGSHGLKFNFAQERYLECVKHGMTHEQALQQVSLEASHFRLGETLTYTRG